MFLKHGFLERILGVEFISFSFSISQWRASDVFNFGLILMWEMLVYDEERIRIFVTISRFS